MIGDGASFKQKARVLSVHQYFQRNATLKAHGFNWCVILNFVHVKKRCDVLLLVTKNVTIKWWVEHTRISIDQGCHHICAFVMTQ
jgi:hypothetical protein